MARTVSTPVRAGEDRMKPLLAFLLLSVQAADPTWLEDKALVTSGNLTADDQLAIVETVVRYAVASARRPCTNHGSKEVLCLQVGSTQEVSPILLKKLADVRPPLLPLAGCRS